MLSYDIFWNSVKVGSAIISTSGLYSHISCKCRLEHPDVYRISIKSDSGDLFLGVCVPERDLFVLDKKIPSKYISGDNIRFCLERKGEMPANEMLIASANMKLSISLLRKMRYRMVNGSPYIVLN